MGMLRRIGRKSEISSKKRTFKADPVFQSLGRRDKMIACIISEVWNERCVFGSVYVSNHMKDSKGSSSNVKQEAGVISENSHPEKKTERCNCL